MRLVAGTNVVDIAALAFSSSLDLDLVFLGVCWSSDALVKNSTLNLLELLDSLFKAEDVFLGDRFYEFSFFIYLRVYRGIVHVQKSISITFKEIRHVQESS